MNINPFQIFIFRPVLAWVLNLLIVAAGAMTMMFLHMIDQPTKRDKVISIEARVDGLTPQEAEKVISDVIQQCVAGAPGLDYYSSASTDSKSQVWAFF